MIQLFEQRDFGNKINATFQYVIQNFRSLGLALLYIVGPVALVAGIATGVMQSNMLRFVNESANARTTDLMAAFQVFSFFSSPSFWLSMLFGLLANVAVVLTTYAHMKLYNQASSQSGEVNPVPISVADIWDEVEPTIGRAIIISILVAIVTGVGMVFFVIPGIYVAVVLSLALAVTVFEETNFGATWDRCFKLIRDKWWSTFGLIIVMSLMVAIVGAIFTIPSAIIGFLVSGKLLPNIPVGWLMIGNVIALVGRTLLNVVIYTALGFQYTNLVERQEGLGMISAINSIGTQPTQARETDEGFF